MCAGSSRAVVSRQSWQRREPSRARADSISEPHAKQVLNPNPGLAPWRLAPRGIGAVAFIPQNFFVHRTPLPWSSTPPKGVSCTSCMHRCSVRRECRPARPRTPTRCSNDALGDEVRVEHPVGAVDVVRADDTIASSVFGHVQVPAAHDHSPGAVHVRDGAEREQSDSSAAPRDKHLRILEAVARTRNPSEVSRGGRRGSPRRRRSRARPRLSRVARRSRP